MERKPDLLILADDYFVKTVEAGYNENYAKQVKTGRINVINSATAKELCNRGEIKTISKPDGEVFVLNPYRQQYISIEQSDLNRSFIADQVKAVQHALKLMGAKAVLFSKEIEDLNIKSIKAKLQGKNKLTNAELEILNEYEASLRLTQKVQYCDLKNRPAPLDKIKEYLDKTGLSSNVTYQGWWEEMEMGRPLRETRKMVEEYNSTVKSSFELAGSLNFLAIRADLNVKTRSTHIHNFKTELHIFFGDVPQEVVDKINS